VDAHSGLVHTVIGTAGNVSDISQAQALLHGEEEAAFGDAGYQGIEKRPESAEATVTWHVAEKRSKVKQRAGTAWGDRVVHVEYAKARSEPRSSILSMWSRISSNTAKPVTGD